MMMMFLVLSLLLAHFRTCGAEYDIYCPPWVNYNASTKQCTCNKYASYEVKCKDHQHAEMALGWCTTFTESRTLKIRCPYFQDRGHNATPDGYFTLPNNISELNDYMCGPMNRKGQVCMDCIDGFGPSYTSLGYECSNCTGHWYRMPLYLLVELVPNTIFYLIILTFQISLTCAPMTGFIWYSQIVSLALTDNGAQPAMRIFHQHGSVHTFLKVILALYGIWNLDFIRYLVPPFCISTKLKMIHIAFLGYISAFYPLCLILLTWLCIKLHGHNFRPLVWLWRPFHRYFVRLRKGWNTTNDIINVFASFFLLLFSKLLYQSVTMLSCRIITIKDNSSSPLRVVAVDPTITCCSKEHLVFAIPGLLILIIFVILPTLLFLLYPTRVSQACLSKCQLGVKLQATLDIFTAKFNSCYKDGHNGGKDMRNLSGLYFYLGLLTCFYHQLKIERLSISFWSYQIILLLSSSVLIALIRPYKKNYMNLLNTLLLALLALQYHLLSKGHTPDQSTKLLVTTLVPAIGFVTYIAIKIISRICKLKGAKKLMIEAANCCNKVKAISSMNNGGVNDDLYEETESLIQPNSI